MLLDLLPLLEEEAAAPIGPPLAVITPQLPQVVKATSQLVLTVEARAIPLGVSYRSQPIKLNVEAKTVMARRIDTPASDSWVAGALDSDRKDLEALYVGLLFLEN